MCGIVAYIGKKQAYPVLIKGLQRLEYRGYDSAGVALINKKGELNVFKRKGKVSDLVGFAKEQDTSGTIGIGHTRWATHGEPNDVNSHPHYSQSQNLVMIHNGIIENYAAIKEGLQKRGHNYLSQTDTEVLIHLIEDIKEHEGMKTGHAVQAALKQVIGAYAIVVLDKNDPDTIVAAKKGSPMVIGIGKDDFYIASDASPIVEYTKNVVYLVGGIGSSCRENGIGACLPCQIVVNFRIGIRQREDYWLICHAQQRFRRKRVRHRKADEHVGTLYGFIK